MISKVIERSVFDKTKELQVYGVPEGYDGFLLSSLFKDNTENILHIARNDKRAILLKTAIRFFCPGIQPIYFPAWDCLPFDRSGPKLAIQAERLSALSLLNEVGREKRRDMMKNSGRLLN